MRLLKSTRLIPRLGSEETRVHAPQLRDHTKLSGGRKLRHELKFIINEGTYLMLRARLAPLGRFARAQRRIPRHQPLFRRCLQLGLLAEGQRH